MFETTEQIRCSNQKIRTFRRLHDQLSNINGHYRIYQREIGRFERRSDLPNLGVSLGVKTSLTRHTCKGSDDLNSGKDVPIVAYFHISSANVVISKPFRLYLRVLAIFPRIGP